MSAVRSGWILRLALVGMLSLTGGGPVDAAGPPASVPATNPALAAWQRPDSVPFPPDRPFTVAKAQLGKMLFFDARLSKDQTLSCASCHNPSYAFEVPFPKPIGASVKPLRRHAPTAMNLAWTPKLFWDGRAASLEDQAVGPITAPDEMALPIEQAIQRLSENAGYVRAFERAFPGSRPALTREHLLEAIATYERTLVSPDTPFDAFVGGRTDAISEAARRGFELFQGKALCAGCHSGWNFTDNGFADVGLPDDDAGRMEVTRDAANSHAMKTPGLRSIAARAPYMHDGSLARLIDVIRHYNTGGVPRPSRDPRVRPLGLTEAEMADLVAFLETLSPARADVSTLPTLPPQ